MNGCDPKAIAEAVRLIVEPGQVTEVRVLDAVTAGYRRPHTESGYFDDPEELAHAVGTIQRAKGFYFIPNVVDPALLARAANRIRSVGKGDSATGDGDIVCRRWLLIDCDPVRATGISSSEAEHSAARSRARCIYAALAEINWPEPIAADYGSGWHLLYRIDLPPDDGGLVQRCLEALAKRFDDDLVTVDRTVFNPSRIWKLYGTVARKGDDTPERPHRLARIVSKPEVLGVVGIDQLEALAGSGATPTRVDLPKSACNGEVFDLEVWIATHHLDVRGPEPWRHKGGSPGRRWVFSVCPWNGDHTNGSAYIVQFDTGAIAAGCHHNGCAGKGWRDRDNTSTYPERNAAGEIIGINRRYLGGSNNSSSGPAAGPSRSLMTNSSSSLRS